MAYDIQTRKAGDSQFADAGEWLTCSQGIDQMRAMSPFSGDLQMDEQWHIIATTLTHASVRTARSQGLIQEDKAKEMAISELFERESVKRQSHAAALLLRRGIGRIRIEEALQWARSKRSSR